MAKARLKEDTKETLRTMDNKPQIKAVIKADELTIEVQVNGEPKVILLCNETFNQYSKWHAAGRAKAGVINDYIHRAFEPIRQIQKADKDGTASFKLIEKV